MLFQKLYPYALVKFDQEHDEPVRNADGFCIEVAKGKLNVLLSKHVCMHTID